MKKTIINFLIIILCCLLSGCSDEQENIYKTFTPGVWEDGIYHNDFADLTLELPEGWRIESYQNNDEDIYYTDMLCLGDSPICLVSIGFDNLTNIENGLDMSEDDYFSYFYDQFPDDYGDLKITSYEEKVCGEQYIVYYNNVPGDNFYLYFRKVDDYMVIIYVMPGGSIPVSYIMKNFV